MTSDIPAYLEVGTPVSAKFKGAFCEATIKKIKKLVKCKVVFKTALGSTVVNSERIIGDLELNSLVQVKNEVSCSRSCSPNIAILCILS